MKTYVVIDVESDGPIPGDYSMTSLGAVILDDKLDKTFKVNIKPISKKYDKQRLDYIDSTDAVDARVAMERFRDWISDNVKNKPVFFSDNNGYDWMFVCWYFWHFLDTNPFGYNSQNINSLYRGAKGDLNVNIEELRLEKITHVALDDALANAKILQKIIDQITN